MFEIENPGSSNGIRECPSPLPDLFSTGIENKELNLNSLIDSSIPSPGVPTFEDSHNSNDEESESSEGEGEGEEDDGELQFPISNEISPVIVNQRGNVVDSSTQTLQNNISTEEVLVVNERVQIPAVDRPSHVSILGGKYLLIANPNPNGLPSTGTQPATASASAPASTASKNTQKCVNVETKEQFLCKVIQRDLSGLNLLGAYHRLDDFSDCVNSIHEIIMSPKFFYLIFPQNYGNVHAYLLAKKRLREGEVAHLFKQMVTAVKHCHSKGIILRDLKLGKFVFTNKERSTIKLESLEDAVVLQDGTIDDGLADKHGCPNYVSPEKAEILRTNSKYPGKATDIWGLGVMLYTMLVGRYPFNDPDHGKLFAKIRRGHFSIPDYLSPNVKCLVRCILRKDPKTRLTCDEILRHPWIIEQTEPSSGILNGTQHSSNILLPMCIINPNEIFREYGTLSQVINQSEIEYNNEDQVVPVYIPPNKKSKLDTRE